MNSIMDAPIAAKFTSKKIDTHLKYVLPFFAPAYIQICYTYS